MIDYRKKLTLDRELYPLKEINMSVESDRGRILSSAAFRRLQKRTQVFALELNAAVRTRLTHSLEVAQNARFIAQSILRELKKEGLEHYGLEGLDNAFISTCEMSSLLHDIGNPPFGHFAEQSINEKLKKEISPLFDKLCDKDADNLRLKDTLQTDLCNYDGNAQAIRIVTKLGRLNLSYTQIASILKYTRCASKPKPHKEEFLSYLRKKPGFYYSEEKFVQTVFETLNIAAGHRFALTYIMEAADDIAYLTADLEDAVDKKILSFEDVYRLIKDECARQNDTWLINIVEHYYHKAQENEETPYRFNMFLTLTRAKLITELVRYVADVYITNHDQIFEGSFNYPLLEFNTLSPHYKAVKILQNISIVHIYRHKEVQTIELSSYKVINGLIESYMPLLELEEQDFSKLVNGQDQEVQCFISQRLIKRLSAKHIVAYSNDVKQLDTANSVRFALLERYYRVRLIIDYISGMTDDFALAEYRLFFAHT
jgi:dGTPase